MLKHDICKFKFNQKKNHINYYINYLIKRSKFVKLGGRLKALVTGLHTASMALRETSLKTENGISIMSKDECDEKIHQIRHAFLNRIHLNRPWAYYLGLCEVLNFINVLLQIYLTDWFLGGAFLGLGQMLAHYESEEGQVEPLDIVFPKVTIIFDQILSNLIKLIVSS